MGDPSRRSIAALVVAAAALTWAAALQWRLSARAPCECSPSNSAPPPAPATGPVSQVVGPLAVQMTALERRVAKLEVRDGGSVPVQEDAATLAPEPERFVSLVSPTKALRVEQLEGGAIAAHNTDPSLTGKVIVVDGRRADGVVEKISITVPPPDK